MKNNDYLDKLLPPESPNFKILTNLADCYLKEIKDRAGKIIFAKNVGIVLSEPLAKNPPLSPKLFIATIFEKALYLTNKENGKRSN